MKLVLDHRALAGNGDSRSDGDDVRVACRSGAAWVELDRALDTGSLWGTAATQLWFRYPNAIGAGLSSAECYVYYGFGAAQSPPANRSNIFLQWDDFETGNLSKWSVLAGNWALTTGQAHRGTYSLLYADEPTMQREIVANPSVAAANVYFDAWLRRDGRSIDVSAVVRFDPSNGTSDYETNLELMTAWCIAKRINGSWTRLTNHEAEPTQNAWFRLGVAISGTRLRVFQDGLQINPQGSASYDVGSELSQGNVGFIKWHIGTNQHVWIDDVVTRPYVDPEPTVILGPQE